MDNDQRHSRVSQENNQAFVSRSQQGFDLISPEIDWAKQDVWLTEAMFLVPIRQPLAKEQRSRLEDERTCRENSFLRTELQLKDQKIDSLGNENHSLKIELQFKDQKIQNLEAELYSKEQEIQVLEDRLLDYSWRPSEYDSDCSEEDFYQRSYGKGD